MRSYGKNMFTVFFSRGLKETEGVESSFCGVMYVKCWLDIHNNKTSFLFLNLIIDLHHHHEIHMQRIWLVDKFLFVETMVNKFGSPPWKFLSSFLSVLFHILSYECWSVRALHRILRHIGNREFNHNKVLFDPMLVLK